MNSNKKRRMQGVVVSDKMDKTVVVEVESIKEHPHYKKRIKRHKRYKAHDEQNKCKVGEKVVIEDCRPMSKDKKWRVVSSREK